MDIKSDTMADPQQGSSSDTMTSVDHETDLPLMSNFDAVHTTHYSADLFCDFTKVNID